MEQVHRAIHEAVLDAGPKQLAHLMGMSHTALLNRSNPNDDSHRLNLEQFLQILVHSKNPEPLQLLASALGYELVPLVKPEGKSLVQALVHMAAESGDVSRAVHDAMADGRVTQIEKAGIQKEIGHVRQSLLVLEESVKAA
ncbi:Rha family transcriptional regulator [Pseudomonas fluorescens NCIMB 11764]|uniref:Rha family transcriptional regulator n=1 Tax=Pseudomonas fluorescens NCIMB 11764 TaxID=1221522 RepID=A0A0K1QQ73_PSEFL|nr:phage regulatory CII family protein [Pseudomonas fluorescens]AKV07896.1 Rha family transcriptional regulator [Pseudomonas fluorescens NCIMB 11764]